MTSQRIPRAQRLRRIRRAVAGAAAALFIASLGVVLAFGRQPATSHATATPDQATPPAAADPWAQDDQSSQAVVPAPSPAPLTSQSS